MIKQLTVQLPNRPGTLAALISVLAEAGVDLKALGVSDRGGGDHGEASMLVSDLSRARAALDAAGQAYEVQPVLAVEMDDRVGGLAAILDLLSRQAVNIQQLYAFVTRHRSKALAVIRCDDAPRASRLLVEAGFRVVSRESLEQGEADASSPSPLGEHLGLDFIW